MFAQNRVLSNAALLVALATMAGSSLTLAQEAQPAKTDEKAAAPAPAATPTSITVIAVTGTAAFKADEDSSLETLKAGQTLKEGAEIFVNPKSLVQLKIGEGQVFTLDHDTRLLIAEAKKSTTDGKETTTLEMPYGRARFDITSTKVANGVKIQTPDATLAVKGTHGIMEKIPGQPTRAYGGELNTGIFNVMHTSGIKVDVTKNHKTSGKHAQTAASADAKTYVSSQDEHSSDSNGQSGWVPNEGSLDSHDERSLSGGSYLFSHKSGVNTLAGDVVVGVDADLGTVITLNSANGAVSVAGSGITGFLGTVQGAALVNTEFGPYLVAIDNKAGPNYAAGTLAFRFWNPGDRTWMTLGSLAPLSVWVPDESGEGGHFAQSAYVFDGLGNLNGTLYASGVNAAQGLDPSITTGNFGIFELTGPQVQRGSMSAQQRMSFPMLQGGGGLTGANSRGSMFATAQFTDGTQGMVLLEIDPRTNYIVNAWSAADGDFGAGLPSNFEPSGVAFSNGQVVLAGNVGGQPTTVTVRPGTFGSHNEATITSSRAGRSMGALAGEGGFQGSVPFPVGTAEGRKTSPMLRGIDPLWLGASYSRNTANSGAFRHMMRNTVLENATDAAACAASGVLTTRLPNAIADHYNEASGVNAALQQFYRSLPPDHPCRCNISNAFR